MKSFIKWANSLDWELKLWWCVMLVMCGVGAYLVPWLGLPLFLCALCWMFRAVRRHKRGLITIVLIVSILTGNAPVVHRQQEAKAWQVSCNAFVLGGVVLVVGGYCVYKFAQFCKKHFPPPPSPPPPPPPDTNNPTTNQPPFVTGNLALLPNLKPSRAIESYDISTLNYRDTTDPLNVVPYQDLITLTFSTSTDLRTWTNAFTVNLWLSSNSMVSVVYDANSVPVSTNRVIGNPYTQPMTNFLATPINRSQPQLFLRDY